MTEQNPYAAPSSTEPAHDPSPVDLDPKGLAKVEAVVKDAGQFWLAIILCVVCSGIGGLIVPIWYLVRLLQWRSLANKYPALLSNGAAPGSIQAKFQSAQWKLIVGLVVGAIIFAMVVLYILTLVFIPQGAIS